MSTNARDFLRAHGIEASEPTLAVELDVPAVTKHRGLASQEDLLRLADDGRLRDLSPVAGIAPALASLEGAGERLFHSNQFPGVWLFDVEGMELVAFERAVANAQGTLVLDGRDPGHPAFALMQHGGSHIVLELLGSHVRVSTVAVASEEAVRLGDLSAPIEVPEMEQVMGECSMADWMEKKLSIALHAGPFERVAAVGTAARLWSTDAARQRGVDVFALLRERRGPLDRARDWFGSLSDAHRGAVFDGGYAEIDRLHDELASLLAACADSPERATRLALSWLERRDDLQSVLVLAERGDNAAALRAALTDLDREAQTYATTWGEIDLRGASPQLEACADEESYQWWAELVL
ncbi:MAG: hypothetical protein Q8Q09_22215 [Deltaproteobacteria bacterium]|nr:hypothetical protein [Deltaproteobacteria bacterium]